jgi:hypothetical protein
LVGHLLLSDQLVLGVDRELDIVAHADLGHARHGASIRIGQRDLVFASPVELVEKHFVPLTPPPDCGDLLGQPVVTTDVSAVCRFVSIAFVEMPHVFRKSFVGIADDLGQGSAGEVAILTVDCLDPSTVHGQQLAAEQIELAAQ